MRIMRSWVSFSVPDFPGQSAPGRDWSPQRLLGEMMRLPFREGKKTDKTDNQHAGPNMRLRCSHREVRNPLVKRHVCAVVASTAPRIIGILRLSQPCVA